MNGHTESGAGERLEAVDVDDRDDDGRRDLATTNPDRTTVARRRLAAGQPLPEPVAPDEDALIAEDRFVFRDAAPERLR